MAWLAGSITALPPRTTAAVWKTLPRLHSSPAALPGSHRDLKCGCGNGCFLTTLCPQTAPSATAVISVAPTPKEATQDPKSLKASTNSGGHFDSSSAQPAARIAARRPRFTAPYMIAEKTPASAAATRPSASELDFVSFCFSFAFAAISGISGISGTTSCKSSGPVPTLGFTVSVSSSASSVPFAPLFLLAPCDVFTRPIMPRRTHTR
mmetsp:Transcript_7678/g.18424  ORF Transcript_7678/g.18424 Transcript_7678/m.18424 type:complete len:208 (-) Transcript_7678:479-1102(-)